MPLILQAFYKVKFVRHSSMDRAMMRRHLEEAERRAAEGIEHVERQKQVVAKLHADGRDTTKAVELLNILVRSMNSMWCS